MATIEFFEIVRINISTVIIFFIRIFIDSGSTCCIGTTSIPRNSIRIAIYIVSINWQYFPMLTRVSSSQSTLQMNSPIFNGFKNQLQLLRIQVFFVTLFTTIFQLDDFHTIHRITVRIVCRTSRPAPCNIMEEQTGQIRRAFEILARPLRRIAHLEPIGHVSRYVAIHSITLQVVIAMTQQTVLIHKATAQCILYLVRTASYAHIMFLRWNPIIIELFEPVRIGIGTRIIIPASGSLINGTYRCQFSVLIIFNALQSFCAERSSITSIFSCTIKILCEGIGVHHFRNRNSITKTNIHAIIHTCLTCFSFLSLHQNYTECSTRTVNRSRRSILQNRYRFNIIRVQRIKTTLDTINQNQRRRARAITNRTGATDIKAHGTIECTTFASNRKVQARHRTLQCLSHISYRTCSKHLGVHHTYGTRHIHFLLSAITYHNNLIQCLRIIFQCYLKRCSLPGHLNGLITDKRNLDYSSSLYIGKLKVTIDSRYRTIRCTFH